MISSAILDAYSSIFMNISIDYSYVGHEPFYIPKFSKKDLLQLIYSAKRIFENESCLLHLYSPFVIVGDVHGNIRDLLRIFAQNGSPITTNYIFLGDYVDRGEHSVEVISLLLALKVSYPKSIYLLRGNHEFREINSIYGFHDQVLDSYDEDLYNAFNNCFDYLPFAALLDSKYFLVHGGISPFLEKVEQITSIEKPVKSFNEGDQKDLICDLVWSDPIQIYAYYWNSERGHGHIYGLEAMKIFLENNSLKGIIRSHQCVYHGVEKFKYGILYTVFSSSCYVEVFNNEAGVLISNEDILKPLILPPIPQLKKKETFYKEFDCNTCRVPLCNRINPIFSPERRRKRNFRLNSSIGSPMYKSRSTLHMRCSPFISKECTFSPKPVKTNQESYQNSEPSSPLCLPLLQAKAIAGSSPLIESPLTNENDHVI